MQILKLTISTSVDLLLRSKGYFFKILSDKLFPFGKKRRGVRKWKLVSLYWLTTTNYFIRQLKNVYKKQNKSK